MIFFSMLNAILGELHIYFVLIMILDVDCYLEKTAYMDCLKFFKIIWIVMNFRFFRININMVLRNLRFNEVLCCVVYIPSVLHYYVVLRFTKVCFITMCIVSINLIRLNKRCGCLMDILYL